MPSAASVPSALPNAPGLVGLDQYLHDNQSALVFLNGRHILVVEDNLLNRQVVGGFLQIAGIRVSYGTNGREGVALAAQGGVDLVLMDIEIPLMSGLDATRLIRRGGGPGHDVPIVAMTAHVMPAERESCFMAGMDDYLAKPVDPAELFACLTG